MTKINYQALREAAERAIPAMERLLMLPVDDDLISEQELKDYGVDIDALNAFKFLAGPETVLALLDEREAKDKAWSAQDNHINQQADRIESLEKKNGELGRALESAENRIAELEEREILLPERSSMLHRTDFHEDYQTVMAYKVSEVINAIRAAGIRIKGE
ncbi:ead/Ea22-like family protein [Escherichia coli]|nr:ead/Ea22-like family protein [Escherichia coli]EHQ8922612.1 ead/Ea22-like family protein [Escherichia coli]EKM7129293.1 ead/Ea22-like family protein [Escherichia coli]